MGEKDGKKGIAGHPPYAEWFCKEYYEKANELKDLAIDEALKSFRKKNT